MSYRRTGEDERWERYKRFRCQCRSAALRLVLLKHEARVTIGRVIPFAIRYSIPG